jgi:hypothetical protein
MVIDALDECNDQHAMAEFIHVIISASRSNRRLPLRIFITSRVEEHIRMRLETSVANSVVLHLSLQDFDARSDIFEFFRLGFVTVYEARRPVMRDVRLPWPSSSNLHALAEKSEGSFIFAVTLMDIIHNGVGHPQAELQNALIAENGLDNLYTQVFSNAPQDDNFDRVLGTVMLLTSPLPINFLADLLQLDAGEIVHTLLGIQSILMIPGSNDEAIMLFHTSLRDFLITPERSGCHFINPALRHMYIAADCLSAIGSPPDDGIFFEGGRGYACTHWCHHFQLALAEDWGDHLHRLLSEIPFMNLLQDVLSNTFDFWVNTVLKTVPVDEALEGFSLLLTSLEVSLTMSSRIWK